MISKMDDDWGFPYDLLETYGNLLIIFGFALKKRWPPGDFSRRKSNHHEEPMYIKPTKYIRI